MRNETVTYASYLARLIGFIAALILVGLAIWLIVGGSDEETGVVVTADDTGSAYNITEDLLSGTEVVIIGDDNSDTESNSILAATDTQIANLTSDTGELPNTGAGQTVMVSVAVSVFVMASLRLIASRRELRTASIREI